MSSNDQFQYSGSGLSVGSQSNNGDIIAVTKVHVFSPKTNQ